MGRLRLKALSPKKACAKKTVLDSVDEAVSGKRVAMGE